jgi:hypothetical protein
MIFVYRIEIPVDAGDGINHYFISEIAPRKPIFYLDHWGKPFFTLLSSAFSFWGFKGILVFNVLLYVISCFVAFKIFDILQVNNVLKTLFPIFILFSYDSFYTISAGLTEPLFACVSICAAYFLLLKKHMYFALFVSILPFCRSEGQLVILIATIIFIYQKQFKILPLLLFSHFVYGIIGWLALNDFLWYFNNNPYPNESIYGSGKWYHFLINSKNYLGYVGLLFSIFALFTGLQQFIQKKIKAEHYAFLFFGFSLFFGILLFHSYFWATGTKGSLGLTRVMMQATPLFFILMIYFVSKIQVKKLETSKKLFYQFQFYIHVSVFFIAGIFLFQQFKRISKDEVQEQFFEKEIVKAAVFTKNNAPTTSTIFYHHPLVAFGMGINMYEKNKQFVHASFLDSNFIQKKIKNRDIIIRDSQFGPVEMGLNTESMKTLKHLNLVHSFVPHIEGKHYHGETWKIDVYQYNTKHKKEPREIFSPLRSARNLNVDKEFIDLLDTTFHAGSGKILKIKINSSIQPIHLILDQENPADYRGHELKVNKNQEYVFKIKHNRKIKLYLWNPQNKNGNISLDTLFISKIQYPPIEK